MSQRQVLQGTIPVHSFTVLPDLFPSVFEQYQTARTRFVQTVADLATRPQNIETLQNAGWNKKDR